MTGSPPVQELDLVLQSLPSLKAPGVNKSKVEAATRICMEITNIPVEPQLVDCLISAFRNSPTSHKLGVLYIIDSIMRQWVASGAAHASGVRKMTDSMPVMMSQYFPAIPEAQKDKVGKLFDIWISSKTLPAGMLADFKSKLTSQPLPAPTVPTVPTVPSAPPAIDAALLASLAGPPPPPPVPQQPFVQQPVVQQPPPQYVAHHSTPTKPAAPNNPSADALLAALSGMNFPPPPPPTTNAPVNPYGNGDNQGFAQYQQNAVSHNTPPVPQLPFSLPQPPAASNPLAALSALLPNPQASQDPTALLTQLQTLQALSQQLGPDGLKTLLGALGAQQSFAPPPPPGFVQPTPQQHSTHYQSHEAQGGQSFGANDYSQSKRDRSRSPDWNRERFSPPNRRDSPTYGTYDANAASNGQQQDQDRGRRGKKNGQNQYRQRSPPTGPRHSPNSLANQHKLVAFDAKLPQGPQGSIKVLSRTLFVGGVKASEVDLTAFFRLFGAVQSCIVNSDKRHAFLKLQTHQDAMAIRESIRVLPESEYRQMFERVNWAVGFGPTQCADYKSGQSTVPINLLTDADRKWLLTAEYGGTGGKDIVGGMIVEEPDIEIGAGPSSKAIHRRGGGQQSQGRGGNTNNNFGKRGNQNHGNDNNHNNHNNHMNPNNNNNNNAHLNHGNNNNNHQNHSNNNNNINNHGNHNHGKRRNKHTQKANPSSDNIGPPPAVPTFGAPIPGFPFTF